MNFWCVACANDPCTGKCEELCVHGIPKYECCDLCFIENNPDYDSEDVLTSGEPLK